MADKAKKTDDLESAKLLNEKRSMDDRVSKEQASNLLYKLLHRKLKRRDTHH